MKFESGYQTCRFCKESDFSGTDTMVKYGVRHYAHYACYIDAGKNINELREWQRNLFPHQLRGGFAK